MSWSFCCDNVFIKFTIKIITAMQKNKKGGGIFIYIPTITSIENALKVYYSNSEIGNKEIRFLFGNCSSATIAKLKRQVKLAMNKNGINNYCANKVNTEIAFEVWGIHINSLKKRFKELSALNLL